MKNNDLREALRLEVARQNTTQHQLADDIGLHRSTLYKLLKGDTAIVNENALALFEALGLELTITRRE